MNGTDQDDLCWYEGSISGNTASYTVRRTNHKNEYGFYAVHIYAYDAAGNYSAVATGITLQEKVYPVEQVKNKKIYGRKMNYPKTIRYKKAFSVKGSIYSDYILTSVTIGVYNSKGKLKTGITLTPYSKSFDIKSRADRYVRFNRLKKGTYYYRIKVKNAAGVSGTLINKKFKVR